MVLDVPARGDVHDVLIPFKNMTRSHTRCILRAHIFTVVSTPIFWEVQELYVAPTKAPLGTYPGAIGAPPTILEKIYDNIFLFLGEAQIFTGVHSRDPYPTAHGCEYSFYNAHERVALVGVGILCTDWNSKRYESVWLWSLPKQDVALHEISRMTYLSTHCSVYTSTTLFHRDGTPMYPTFRTINGCGLDTTNGDASVARTIFSSGVFLTPDWE
jgi:hypothetical protein